MTNTEQPELRYEEARDELISIVQRLETGGTTLEESLALWERGEELAKICNHWLDSASERLAQLTDQSSSEAENGSSEDATSSP